MRDHVRWQLPITIRNHGSINRVLRITHYHSYLLWVFYVPLFRTILIYHVTSSFFLLYQYSLSNVSARYRTILFPGITRSYLLVHYDQVFPRYPSATRHVPTSVVIHMGLSSKQYSRIGRALGPLFPQYLYLYFFLSIIVRLG